MISVFVSVKMLFLLDSSIEMVDFFSKPLRRHIPSSVKIEDQIKGRKAIWLIEVKNYLRAIRIRPKNR